MICAFWNSKSISVPGRKKFIDDNLVPLQLDYIGFKRQKRKVLVILFLGIY
jgi:hypothetical protein